MEVKRLYLLILAALLLCALPSCKKQGTPEAEQNGENVPDATADDYDNRLSGMRYGDILETDEVWYFNAMRASSFGKACVLRYYVKENGESDILCSDPTCMHKDKNCPAFGVTNIYKYGGRIYYQKKYHPQGSHTLYGIFSMDPDGGSRELVRELKCYEDDIEASANGDFMMHRGELFVYICRNSVNDAEPGVRSMLKKLEPNSDEMTVLFDETREGAVDSRVFFYGKFAYVLMYHSETIDDPDSTDGYPWGQSVIELFRIDIETGESELIKKDEDSTCIFSECCFVDRNEDIYIVNSESVLIDGETVPRGAAAYKYIDGKFTEIMRFEDEENGYYFGPICGDNVLGGLCFKMNGDVREKAVLWLTDYEGNTIVKDTLPLGFLTEEERQKVSVNIGSFAGNGDLILRFCIYRRSEDGESIKHDYYIVHYDYSDGSLKETLLGMSKEE